VAAGEAAIVNAGGRALAVICDVSMAAEVDEMFGLVTDELGPVRILVNNAALTTDQRHLFDGDEEWWDTYLRVNLKSQYLCTDRAARIMARHGGGAIVNVSSGGATRAHRGLVAYDTAKGGTEAFTRATAIELAPYGIRVNALVPGFVATDPDEDEQVARLRDQTVPLGRGGTAEDLAGPAVFLVSDDAAYITGSTVLVDGGALAQLRSPQVDPMPPTQFPAVEDV
jgi:3-oxoacyl-[acyl-carrier protein] reductase